MKQQSHRHQYGNCRVTSRQYTSALRTHRPSRCQTWTETTQGSNTHPPKANPIGPRTGYRRTPPIPHTTEHTITPTPSNILLVCSSSQRAERTSKSSRRNYKSPSTTPRYAQRASQPTCRDDGPSSSGINYHSSPGWPNGSPASTPTSRKNTTAAHATTPPRRTGNTSRYAPSIRAGTYWWAGSGGNPTAT